MRQIFNLSQYIKQSSIPRRRISLQCKCYSSEMFASLLSTNVSVTPSVQTTVQAIQNAAKTVQNVPPLSSPSPTNEQYKAPTFTSLLEQMKQRKQQQQQQQQHSTSIGAQKQSQPKPDLDALEVEFFETWEQKNQSHRKASVGLRYRFDFLPLGHVSNLTPNRKRVEDAQTSLVTANAEVVPTTSTTPVPELAHGLETVLKVPGLHLLKDIQSDHFYFNPFLYKIHQPTSIDYDNLPAFITTSKDIYLHELAASHGCKYKGSTSSITPLLVNLYMLISNFQSVNTSPLASFSQQQNMFTRATRKQACVVLRPNDGLYSIDSDKGPFEQNNKILLDLGKSMEKMLVTPPREFYDLYVKRNDSKVGKQIEKAALKNDAQDAYHYMKYSRIMMRSQLDCYSSELKGPSKVFDLKTRATSLIRHDVVNYQRNAKVFLNQIFGLQGSFEREYYDLIRSAFIKYIFQARIGSMDGMFITYHNTANIFGFEYVPLEEMEKCIFGNSHCSNQIFNHSLALLQEILDAVTERIPSGAIRLVFSCEKGPVPRLVVYAEKLKVDHGWNETITTPQRAILPSSLGSQIIRLDLLINVYVNGEFVSTPLIMNPNDDLKIEYKLIESDSNVAHSTFIDVLHRAYGNDLNRRR